MAHQAARVAVRHAARQALSPTRQALSLTRQTLSPARHVLPLARQTAIIRDRFS